MAKRLTEKQKNEIVQLFISGINIKELSKEFNCTQLTISRNLKRQLGESNYKEICSKGKSHKKLKENKNEKIEFLNKYKKDEKIDSTNKNYKKSSKKKDEEESFELSQFIEIAPLNCEIEDSTQKDLSSIPIADIDFPKTVFMIVDKGVELETKYLKDYPKWQFLSQNELKRKTIEIYFELKIAKSFCGKDQNVIKVPNADVFKLVAPILRSKGISRIITSDKLIAL